MAQRTRDFSARDIDIAISTLYINKIQNTEYTLLCWYGVIIIKEQFSLLLFIYILRSDQL